MGSISNPEYRPHLRIRIPETTMAGMRVDMLGVPENLLSVGKLIDGSFWSSSGTGSTLILDAGGIRGQAGATDGVTISTTQIGPLAAGILLKIEFDVVEHTANGDVTFSSSLFADFVFSINNGAGHYTAYATTIATGSPNFGLYAAATTFRGLIRNITITNIADGGAAETVLTDPGFPLNYPDFTLLGYCKNDAANDPVIGAGVCGAAYHTTTILTAPYGDGELTFFTGQPDLNAAVWYQKADEWRNYRLDPPGGNTTLLAHSTGIVSCVEVWPDTAALLAAGINQYTRHVKWQVLPHVGQIFGDRLNGYFYDGYAGHAKLIDVQADWMVNPPDYIECTHLMPPPMVMP